MADLYIAFQSDSSTAAAINNLTKQWNRIEPGVGPFALVDELNSATAISLTAGGFYGDFKNLASTLDGDTSGDAAWVDEAAVVNDAFSFTDLSTATFILSGYNEGDARTLEFFSHNPNSGREFTVSVNGGAGVAVPSFDNLTATATVEATADVNGEIAFTFTANQNANSYINAMRVLESGTTPELSISAADDVTSDSQTVTFTLANNSGAPTGATLNGTDVGTLTDQGSGVYAYTSPLIADDATADLVVSVDSTTVSTQISYANSYPYELVTHGTQDANSIFFDTQFATTGPVEWGVVTDYDSAVVVVDHAGMDAAEDELNDVDLHSTEVAAGTTTATYKYFVPESGATGTWQVIIEVTDGETPAADNWPFSKNVRYSATPTWEWGKRHPLTGMRVRMYK